LDKSSGSNQFDEFTANQPADNKLFPS